MTLKQAIKIVERHNKWRRSHRMDRNRPKMGDVYELGKALDVLLIIAHHYTNIYNMDKVNIHPKTNNNG